MKPEQVTKEVAASGILGPRRRGVPRRPQVAGRAPRRRPAALPVRQRRRGRAGHLQGPLDPRERPAPPGRVDGDRRLRAAGAQCVRLHPRRVRPALPAPAGSDRRGLRRRAARRERILGTDFALDLVAHRGAGSYVCGEASGLLTSIEGRKGYPRNRPPRLTVRGLYQRPTVVNNVETLSNLAGILVDGRRGIQEDRHREEPGHAARLDLRPRAAPGRLRARVRLPGREVHLRGLRRRAGRRAS